MVPSWLQVGSFKLPLGSVLETAPACQTRGLCVVGLLYPCLQGLFVHGLLGASLGLLMEQVWVGLDGKLLVLSGNHAWSRRALSLKLHSFEDGAHSGPVTSGTFGVSRPEWTGNL